MEKLTTYFTRFTATKSLIILLYAWLIYMGDNFFHIKLFYILAGETFIFSIILISITYNQRKLLNILTIIISILQVITVLVLLYFYHDYRWYFTSNMMINYWTPFQSICIAIFLIFILKHFKMKWLLFVALLAAATMIPLVTILNETCHGNNSHLYWPLVGVGLCYMATSVFLKKRGWGTVV